jgi:hypothetical protein
MIDWNNCLATPRCIGYSSLPEFFHRDWNKGFSLTDSSHMLTWEIQNYAQIYTEAIEEADCSDAKYAREFAVYHAIAGALRHCQCTY